MGLKIRRNNKWEDFKPRIRRNGSWGDATVRKRVNGRWEVISKKEYTKTYNPTWSASYNGSGAYSTTVRTAKWGDTLSHYALWYNTTVSKIKSWNEPFIKSPHWIYTGDQYTVRRTTMNRLRNRNGIMYQGENKVTRLQDNHGREGSMVAFNDEDLRRDLKGAEILSCYVYIRCHQAEGSRVRAVFGYHNYDHQPSQYGHSQYWATSEWFKPGEGKWVRIPNSLGERLRDGKARGITLYANNSDNAYVGSFHGKGNSNPPKLRITYKK